MTEHMPLPPACATILLPWLPDMPLKNLGDRLGAILGSLGLPVLDSRSDTPHLLRLATRGPEVVLMLADAPLDRRVTDACHRPDDGGEEDNRVLQRLARHGAALTLAVSDLRGRFAGTRRHLLGLAQRLTREILRLNPGALVVWAPNGTVFTGEEFLDLRGQLALVPSETAAAPAPQPVMDGPPDSPFTEIRARRDRVRPLRVRVGGLPDPAEVPKGFANSEPDLPGPATEVHDRLREIFRQAQLPNDGCLAADRNASLSARLSVYVMTGTVIVLAFPVGMGLLTYNILRGENFTATARTMALTGIGLALNALTGLNLPLGGFA